MLELELELELEFACIVVFYIFSIVVFYFILFSLDEYINIELDVKKKLPLQITEALFICSPFLAPIFLVIFICCVVPSISIFYGIKYGFSKKTIYKDIESQLQWEIIER